MARKTAIVTIRDREQDLTFEITEMTARATQAWLARSLLLLVGGGNAELPRGFNPKTMSQGQLIGIAVKSMMTLDYDRVEPLMDELLTRCCVRILESGVKQPVALETLDGYIEDFTTLFKLQKAVLELHFGFFIKEYGPMFAPLKERLKGYLGLSNTPTSKPCSES